MLLSLAQVQAASSRSIRSRAPRVVQPGVRNLAISEAAAPHGLYYAPDPSSQIACSIGGNVAENAGGVHCLKYGLTVHNVLGLRVVTIDGELVEIGGEALDAPGYDLLALMIGSEGMLGGDHRSHGQAAAEAASARRCVLAAFDDVEQGRRGGGRRSSPPASSRPAWR
ncbi:MAG: FAD-binding protein [Comamonadaceae bacterium]|nr:FAD-binding protein [Comamonadaceae bacterium]